ncbi:MAG: glycosyltransferase family 4 protein [Euryarchaeota archaeon]|nr:glycosyltransferase family 4 protein [Euryarchaeota archaeon]
MKVALLSIYSFDEVKGGTELFTEHLQSTFNDAQVFTYSSSYNGSGIDLTKFNLEEARKGMVIGRYFHKHHRADDFDIIISNSIAGWYLGVSRLDIPMLNVFHFTMRGLADQVLRGTPGYFPSKYISSIFEKLASVGKSNVAVSRKVARELWSLYRIRSKVIEHGVDMELFRPISKEKARDALGLEHDVPIALFVGRPDHTKGFDIVLRAAKERPNIQFVCITSPRVCGTSIVARHDVPNHCMPLYYSAADLLLFPSRYESVGYVGLEAMACDLPVVVSRTGVFEDIDEGDVGRIVPSWDASAYVEAIDDVLSHPFHPRRAVKDRFSIERFRADYRAAAIEAIEERRK